MTQSESVASDEDFFHYQPQDLLTLSYIESFRSRPQLGSKGR